MHTSNKPPVISVVGWADSGKTTFLVELLRELKARGYQVGTIKHHPGDIDVDRPGKDTWRHAQAGASAVALAGATQFALFKAYQQEDILGELAALMPEMDIIITEGFKSDKYPKIEVRRQEIDASPAAPDDELIALIDPAGTHPRVPCFAPDQYASVVDLLEEMFLAKK